MKRIFRYAIAVTSVLTAIVFTAHSQAQNPIIHADVPDISVIRVGNTYYMSSTTMHMSPGLPIMKSTDLVNWKIISYAYDTLGTNDQLTLNNGKTAYGQGSWASSLRYHKGTFYVTTFSSTTGKTYVFSNKTPEKNTWKRISFSPSLHDHSLFFDDDGKVYLIYGAGKITLAELKDDLTGLKPGVAPKVIIENATAIGLPANHTGRNTGLAAEGSQLFKVNGKYYLFNISWPPNSMRTVLIHRADKIDGPYEGRIALQDQGVAQGGLISTPKGEWFSYLFQDHGSVGRIPYLVPVKWENGWPVLGVNGKVPMELNLPKSKGLIPNIVNSDEFTRKKGNASLPLVWQWNHNPDNKYWSLTQRPGFLRITTLRTDTSVLFARNMLTQRTIGPECSGNTSMDVSNMKEGDVAGLVLLQKKYAYVGVKANADGTKAIIMVNGENAAPVEVAAVPLTQKTVYLKAEGDFKNKTDKAYFYYSLDGKTWTAIGNRLNMSYTLPHFMGYRFGLFTYATKTPGGSVDFDYFRITDKMSEKK